MMPYAKNNSTSTSLYIFIKDGDAAMSINALLFLMSEVLLLVVMIVSLILSLKIKRKEKEGGLSADIVRGDKGMNVLHIFFGVFAGYYIGILGDLDIIEGFNVLFVLINMGMLYVLFYENMWFRNKIIYPLWHRMTRDK